MSTTDDTPTRRRILVVDSHPLIRRGLTDLIEADSDLMVCAAAATYAAAVDAIAETGPDMVITDLSLDTDDDGLRLVKFIRSTYADLPVLMLTMHALPIYTERALEAGATGCVTKTAKVETLMLAIRRTIDGEAFVSPEFIGDHELH